MNRKLRIGLITLGLSSLLGLSRAASGANITLYPVSPGVAGVSGNTSTSAPGYGGSSFQAGPTLDADGKSEIYITLAELGLSPTTTIADIQSITYFTNKAGGSGAVDWTLNLYTNKQSGDTTFYHSHLTAEPYFANQTTASGGQWNQWSTDGATPLRFYDGPRSGDFGNTSPQDPTLATLQGGTFTYAPTTHNLTGFSHDYRGEGIEYISFQTGSAWAPGFSGLLDGFNITLKSGASASVNFEAVPLPKSVWAGIVLLGGFGLTRLGRKRALV